jgi:hypothetical protein
VCHMQVTSRKLCALVLGCKAGHYLGSGMSLTAELAIVRAICSTLATGTSNRGFLRPNNAGTSLARTYAQALNKVNRRSISLLNIAHIPAIAASLYTNTCLNMKLTSMQIWLVVLGARC